MKNTMLKKTMPLVAATWTDAFRRVCNRIALVAAAICAAAAPLSSFAEAKEARLAVADYKGSTTLEYFQALVKLSDNDAYGFSYDAAGGSTATNIWFTSDDGATIYPHEIDKWDTSGNSFVWVRLPELKQGTTFKMHWSDSASDVQSASGDDVNVWKNFVGVWHMNETGTTAELDSTGHGLTAAPINNSSASTSINTDTNGGQVGNGRAVSQATMFKVAGHSSHISEAKTFTIGGWVKRTGSGDYPRIFVGNPNNSTRTKWEVYGWSATELIARGGDKDFTRNVDLSTSAGWKYLTVVYTGTTATIYDNGAPVGNAGAINNAVQDSYFTIGAVSGANNRSFVGTFDEVRMYNGALSADRVKADYDTMNNPTEFLKLCHPSQATLKVSGYRKMGTIENFQALVKLSDSDAYGFSYADCASSDGSDLWFTDADGNLIPHDIDTWNPSGDSYVWVKIPTLTIGTKIVMHWGEPRTQEQTCTPFDTWEGYVGVWHMNATGTTAEPDSTANGFNATPYITSGTANINRDANGKVGSGRANIQNANLRVSDYKDKLTSQTAFTMSGWFKQSTTDNSWPRLFVGNPSNTDRSCWEMWRESASVLNAIGNGTSKTVSWSVSLGTDWHYLTLVYNGTTATLYDNGVGKGDKTVNTPQHKTYLSIGGAGTTADRSFVGTFDEVRMYNGALSADRIAADYATMNAPTEFITLDVPPQNEPDTYLEYVESDGHQWIDSKVIPGPAANTTPVITSMIIDADVDIMGGISGVLEEVDLVGNGWNNFEPLKTYNGKYSAYVKASGETTSGVAINSGRHRVISTAVNGQKLAISVDGVTTTSTGSNVSQNSPGDKTLYLFARNHNIDRYCRAKLWGLKIYINNELVRDFVPGMKGGEVGLYDRLNDAWYTSGSKTSLLRGPITSRNNASLSNAPDAYLEYVESDGRQRIDTGVTPGPNTAGVTSMTVDADVDWISGDYMLSSNWNDFHPLRNVNGKIGAAFKNTGGSVMSLGSDKDMNSGRRRVITTAVYNKPLTVNVDGDTAASSGNVGSLGSGRTLYAFASNDGSAAGSGHSTAKLYGMKIYIGNELVCDYVPGIKNGVAGLYDMQNDEWHYVNSGIELIPGPVVNPQNLPDAYLDYVKSTGAQWVSVGITPTQTMKFDVDVDWISGNTLLGQSNYGLSPLTVNNGTIASAWWMVDGAAAADTGVALDTGRRRFVITTSNSAYVSTSVDGGTPALSGGYSNRNNVNPSDLYLFAIHYGGTVGNAGGHSTAKLYGLKIYGANGALMRDYVPGIKDNVVGLYDRVNDKFFSSGTSTPLVAGPVVDRSKPDSFVEYVESDGNQWVDTGVDGRAGVKSEADIDWISGAPLGVIGNSHCLLLQDLSGIGGQALGSGEVKTFVAVNSGRHLIVSEVGSGSKMTVTVDGTTSAQSANNVSSSASTGATIWMFAAHSTGGGAWGAGNSKFYELKLWRTGSDGVRRIQRHFIPCLKGGRAGLYDAVSGVIFYSHSGTDLVASSTTRTLSVWRNEADDASLDNAANWCGGLPNGTDAVVCAPWLQTVSTANDLTYANLTVDNGAAIDLSGHTLTLTGLTGANSGSFVSGAAVTLDLSGRTDLRTIAKSANPYVVTWESQPSATFTLDSESSRRFKIEPDATGVKIIYIAGGAMLIVY